MLPGILSVLSYDYRDYANSISIPALTYCPRGHGDQDRGILARGSVNPGRTGRP